MADELALGLGPTFQDVFAIGRVNPNLEEAIRKAQEAINTLVAYNESNHVVAGGHLEGLLLSLLIPVLAGGLEALGVGADLALMLSKGAITLIKGDIVSLLFDAVWPVSEYVKIPDPHFSETSLRNALEFTVSQFVSGKAVLNARRPARRVRRIADPIVPYRGEFERQRADFEVGGAGIDFTLKRTYQSRVMYAGPLGPNWDHSYNLRLREESDYVVVRLTGALGEERFIQHPRFDEPTFKYFVPPNGVHSVIIPDLAGSFIYKRPQGDNYFYEATDQPREHRIKRIEDRFGNYLDFRYAQDGGQLEGVFVNSRHRFVAFRYDESQRIEEVEDHTGRVVRYSYDDWGYLESVTGPAVAGELPLSRERYEYEQVGPLRRLARVWNAKNQILVENEYDQSPLSDYFGYVVRQIQNRGETQLFYESLTGEVDPSVSEQDRPTLRVWAARRNGHQSERIFNALGNELVVRQQFADGCGIHEAVTRSRYNADGQLIARVDPEGAVVQHLYGRDHISDSLESPDLDPLLGDVTISQRMSFGNLLATVTRAKRMAGVYSLLDPTFWEDAVPGVKWSGDPDDIVTKSTYDPISQLCLSRSDPRHTISADPVHVESAGPGDAAYDPNDPRYQDHQRFLTRFEYGPGPRFELRRTLFPDRTQPDGTLVQGIIDVMRSYDASGRLLERVDPRGYEWFNEYYPPSPDPAEGCKEGYLRRQLVPHLDWILNNTSPDILEVRTVGGWQASALSLVSAGVVGDEVTLFVEGVRITLYQSLNPQEKISGNDQVEVRVDAQLLPVWDQTAQPSYVAENLPAGIHTVVIRDVTGVPVSLGRVRTHVSRVSQVDGLGRVLVATDPGGVDTQNVVDAMGRLTQVTRGSGPNPSVVHYVYDSTDRLIVQRQEWRDEQGQERPEKSIIARYAYDSGGLLLMTTAGPEQGGGENRSNWNRYDQEDNLCESINPRGRRTYYQYDAVNRRTQIIRAACSADCSITSTDYDLANHVSAQRNPLGAWHLNGYIDARGERQSGIDTRGRIRVSTDPLGHLSVTDFDALDKPTAIRQFQRRADATFELLSRRTIVYDEHGDATAITDAIFEVPIPAADAIRTPDLEFLREVRGGNVRFSTTQYFLDAQGYAVFQRNPDGGLQIQRFDGQGRLFDRIDADGRRLFWLFDGNGNVVRRYTYDPIRDPATGLIAAYEVFVQILEYDELDRLTKEIDPLSNQRQRSYDSLGNMTRIIDPLGNSVQFEFNAFHEQTAQIRERTTTGLGGGPALAPQTIRMEYDTAGNLIAVVDPAQRRTEFAYDALDRLVRSRCATGPGQPSEERQYDAAGNLMVLTDRNGLVRRNQYDLLNRRIRSDVDAANVAARNAPSPLSPTFALFHYDAAGRLIYHENDYCIVRLQLDSRGLALREDLTIRHIAGTPGPQSIRRRFDEAGRQTSLTYPSGREISISYNHTGRITVVRNVASPPDYPGRANNAAGFDVVRYGYAGLRRIRAEMGNNLTLTNRFDGAGRALEQVVNRANGTEVWRLQILRDAAGWTRVETASQRHGGRSRKFALDSVYRLTSYNDAPLNWLDPAPLLPARTPVDPLAANGQALLDAAIGPLTLPAGQPVFDYDIMGNRVQTSEPAQPVILSQPNELNQYIAVGGNPWRYDENGNLRSDGANAFAYDSENNLQTISNLATGASQVAYYRDALGRVVAEATPAATIFRIHDGALPVVELGPAGRVEYTVDQIARAIIHAAVRGNDYWITRSGEGSVRLVTDSRGRLVSVPVYRPFGSPEDRELALSPLRIGFGGLWFSRGIPFLHSQTRSYRTDVGRYLQRDPAVQADGASLYAYAGNNPVDRWDPTGLSPIGPVDPMYWPPSQVTIGPDEKLQSYFRDVINQRPLTLFPEGIENYFPEEQFEPLLVTGSPNEYADTLLHLSEPDVNPLTMKEVDAVLFLSLTVPFQGAGFIADPLTVALEVSFGEAVGYGTRQGLIAAGVDEQTAELASFGTSFLSGSGVRLGLGALRRLAQSEVYVYRIIDVPDLEGEEVYVLKYGISSNPGSRIRGYARELGSGFRAMQIISNPVPRLQGLALETSLNLEAFSEGEYILNLRLQTMAEAKGGAAFFGVVQTPWSDLLETPSVTILNPAIYRR